MSTVTDIEWTDVSWNPVRGCSLVSAGCAHCYAMKQAHRFSGPGKPYEGLTELGPQGPRWTGKIKLVPELLDEPLGWKKPRRVFVNSMSDLFHEDVPEEFINRVWAEMCIADWHVYQILTKRPQRMLDFLTRNDWQLVGSIVASRSQEAAYRALARKRAGFKVCEHVWLGVSVEDQKTADERIPLLLQTPAAVRWISLEPMLGPVDISCYLQPPAHISGRHVRLGRGEWIIDADGAHLMWRGLDWVVVGGESGPGARLCDVAWIRSIVRQCRAAGVPVFVKQLGSQPRGWCVDRLHGDEPESAYQRDHCGWYEASEIPKPCAGRCLVLYDKKGGDPSEWPEGLRVREWPR
jgi:protein gp37